MNAHFLFFLIFFCFWWPLDLPFLCYFCGFLLLFFWGFEFFFAGGAFYYSSYSYSYYYSSKSSSPSMSSPSSYSSSSSISSSSSSYSSWALYSSNLALNFFPLTCFSMAVFFFGTLAPVNLQNKKFSPSLWVSSTSSYSVISNWASVAFLKDLELRWALRFYSEGMNSWPVRIHLIFPFSSC